MHNSFSSESFTELLSKGLKNLRIFLTCYKMIAGFTGARWMDNYAQNRHDPWHTTIRMFHNLPSSIARKFIIKGKKVGGGSREGFTISFGGSRERLMGVACTPQAHSYPCHQTNPWKLHPWSSTVCYLYPSLGVLRIFRPKSVLLKFGYLMNSSSQKYLCFDDHTKFVKLKIYQEPFQCVPRL